MNPPASTTCTAAPNAGLNLNPLIAEEPAETLNNVINTLRFLEQSLLTTSDITRELELRSGMYLVLTSTIQALQHEAIRHNQTTTTPNDTHDETIKERPLIPWPVYHRQQREQEKTQGQEKQTGRMLHSPAPVYQVLTAANSE